VVELVGLQSAHGLEPGQGRVAPWWGENSKEAYSSGLANLATALTNWSDSKNGTRRGPKVRFPRFKGKRHGMSCRFTTGAFGLAESDRRHVTLPRIGVVRAHESTRTLARHGERGSARIRSATVSSRGGRVLLVLGEITRNDPAPGRPEATVGVDLGIKSLTVLSTGEIVPNPKHLEIALRELRRLQRRTARRARPDRRTGEKPSARWRQTPARIATPPYACGERPPRRAASAHPPPAWCAPTARSCWKTSTWPA
jgi:putative transposase